MGISRYHLCHIFKIVTGNTASHYWQSVRCEKARRMLRKGHSVAETAEKCGFASPAYFSKVYRKCFSVLPGADKS
ncbi:MAG: helix-turn-helix transcriptional regulator [Clostridia bacterium]|nr:helix-turn-helix transcriptional regulator [Clostridia bacterium]